MERNTCRRTAVFFTFGRDAPHLSLSRRFHMPRTGNPEHSLVCRFAGVRVHSGCLSSACACHAYRSSRRGEAPHQIRGSCTYVLLLRVNNQHQHPPVSKQLELRPSPKQIPGTLQITVQVRVRMPPVGCLLRECCCCSVAVSMYSTRSRSTP